MWHEDLGSSGGYHDENEGILGRQDSSPSPRCDPQRLLHVLVDPVGYAHSWNDLREVGGNAPVEASYTLLG